MIKGLILDLDGVICDTAHFHFLAWKALAATWNIELTEADNENLKGVSRADSLDYILDKGKVSLSAESKLAAMENKNNHYLTWVESMGPSHVFPGVVHFLEEAKNAKYKIALGSASKNATLVLNKLGITHYFNAIVDASAITQGKPHPETFLTAAKMLHLLPAECAVFEDAFAGVEAANAAGMLSIGIGSENSLPNATIVVNSLGAFQLTKAFQNTTV